MLQIYLIKLPNFVKNIARKNGKQQAKIGQMSPIILQLWVKYCNKKWETRCYSQSNLLNNDLSLREILQ